jgi:hypothetical protein
VAVRTGTRLSRSCRPRWRADAVPCPGGPGAEPRTSSTCPSQIRFSVDRPLIAFAARRSGSTVSSTCGHRSASARSPSASASAASPSAPAQPRSKPAVSGRARTGRSRGTCRSAAARSTRGSHLGRRCPQPLRPTLTGCVPLPSASGPGSRGCCHADVSASLAGTRAPRRAVSGTPTLVRQRRPRRCAWDPRSRPPNGGGSRLP